MKPTLPLVPILLFIILWAFSTTGYHILVISSPPVHSHFLLSNIIVKELVNRGHDVTFISSFESKIDEKNMRNIVVTRNKNEEKGCKNDLLEVTKIPEINRFNSAVSLAVAINGDIMNDTQVQKLLNSDEKFDLLIMEAFFIESNVGFAHHFDCPLIVLSTVGSSIWSNYYVRNQATPSYVPEIFSDLSGRMNFWQRTRNFLLTYVTEYRYNMYHLPEQEALLHKYFPTAPSLNEVINKRTQLVLLNSHPSISVTKPSVPNMIEIGGFHISEPKPLIKDLKYYLDEAKEGVILFSMGSYIKSIMLPDKIRKIFIKVFAQLSVKILWKFEEELLPNKPFNVRIEKWLPQNDILAHPNVKLFITHGGLLSTSEAVYYGVPILGIPVFGDQAMNMAWAENIGIGKSIPLGELCYENLLSAIKELLNNKSYREITKFRSAIFRNQPMRPLDLAMFWIEHVLRHKNLDHLKTGAVHLNWLQIHSIDVLAFLLSIILVVLFILYVIIKNYCRSISLFKKLPNDKKKKQ